MIATHILKGGGGIKQKGLIATRLEHDLDSTLFLVLFWTSDQRVVLLQIDRVASYMVRLKIKNRKGSSVRKTLRKQ